MKGVWGQLRVPYFVMSVFSNSAQVLDLSNSCFVHHFPLSTRRMSKKKTKNDCDAPGMLAQLWWPFLQCEDLISKHKRS